jgi:hypothetical protein
MGRFSSCLSLIAASLLVWAALPLQAADRPPSLLQQLVENRRFVEVLQISLMELRKESCQGACQGLWSRNAARSLLLIGDHDGAMVYLRYGAGLLSQEAARPNHDLLAYAALQKRDLTLWGQYRPLLGSPRADILETLAGPDSHAIATRRQLAKISESEGLSSEQKSLMLRYAEADQTSPWVTGTLSALVPGSGLLLLGMESSAAQSFLLTGVSAWASSELYKHNLRGAGLASALIASVFYIGGIQATVRSTHEFNAAAAADEKSQLMKDFMPALEFEWAQTF